MRSSNGKKACAVVTAVSLAVALVLVYTVTGLAAARMPAAPGRTIYQSGNAYIDASNANQGGYIMAKYDGGEKRVKLIVASGEMTYSYDLRTDGEFEVFPLQMGSGVYTIEFYEQVSGSKYAQKYAKELEVELDDEYACYLLPNQYVNYTADSKAVELSRSLSADAQSDHEKVRRIFNYVRAHIQYDYVRAGQVMQGKLSVYIPDIDEVIEKRMGICFDYSALLASMTRAQGIPTKMVIGYADKKYHAWNKVLLDGNWERLDATFAAQNVTGSQYTVARTY